MPRIHSSSIVERGAALADDVEVGPFCTIGPHVKLGAGCRLISHVVIAGHTTIGSGNVFHPGAVIGAPPQDLKYRGEPTGVQMGNNNQVREHCTVHCGTVQGGRIFGGGITRIGDSNLLMVNVHVGHDCQLGSRSVFANNVMLAGHIIIGNNVIMNGVAGVNAWVTIGDFAYIGGAARVHHDCPPFVKLSDKDDIRAINKVGLQRGGFTEEDIAALDRAGRLLFFGRKKPPRSVAIRQIQESGDINPHVQTILDFLKRQDEGKQGRYLEGLRSRPAMVAG